MYVIMDLEWFQTDAQAHPTQIAALRVDADWNGTDEFYSLIHMKEQSAQQWEHVAFSGAAPEEFMQAPSAQRVFAELEGWLKEDDVLCWWQEEPAAVFVKMRNAFVEGAQPRQGRILRSYFNAGVKDGGRRSGTLYQLCGSREIPTPAVEHCSRNDVLAVRNLMRHIGMSTEVLSRPPYALMENGRSLYTFFCEEETGIAHSMEVGCRSASFPLKGMGTVKSCLDKGYRPCPECCTETWLDKLRDYNRAKIAKRDSRYFFFSHSPIFHRGTCDCILTSTQGYHGRESYEECVRLGCIPCELCKPEAEETVEVKAEERVEEKAEENAEAAKANKVDYSWMTPKEKRALDRYEEAVRLQDSVDMRKLSKQQRRDMLVLNATDCAFWAAAGYRSFHLRHCRRMDKLSNFKGFYTYQQAVYAGYQPCRECKPSAKQDVSIYMTLDTRRVEGERLENVLALCSRLQLSYTYEEPFISMSTEQGEWKINVLRNPVIPEHKPEGEQTFHRQHRMFLSMSDAVRYIAKHDCVQSQSLESKIMKSRRRSKK